MTMPNRPMLASQATGVLVTALGVLAVHYGHSTPSATTYGSSQNERLAADFTKIELRLHIVRHRFVDSHMLQSVGQECQQVRSLFQWVFWPKVDASEFAGMETVVGEAAGFARAGHRHDSPFSLVLPLIRFHILILSEEVW